MHHTIRVYTWLTVAGHGAFGLIMGMYALFMMKRGMSLLDVHTLNMVFSGMIVLLEIPSGIFADIWGRKVTVVYGEFLFAAGFLIHAQAHSYSMFAFGEALIAVGLASQSGAFDAWFVDRLKKQGFNGSLEKVFARVQIAGQATGMTTAILGSLLFEYWDAGPWLIGAVIFLCSGTYAAYCIHEDRDNGRAKRRRTIMNTIHETNVAGLTITRSSIRSTRTLQGYALLMGIGALAAFAFQAPNMQYQPYFLEHLGSKTAVGFVAAGVSLFMIVGSRFVRESPTLHSKLRTILVMLIACGLLIGSSGVATGALFATSWFLFHEVFRGVFIPVHKAALNQVIPSEERATLLSFNSLAGRVGALLGLPLFGWLAQSQGISVAWMIAGGALALGSLLILLFVRKRS